MDFDGGEFAVEVNVLDPGCLDKAYHLGHEACSGFCPQVGEIYF